MKEFKQESLGKPYLDSKEEKERRKKSIKHENSFIKSEKDPDIIKKRFGSDLFK